MWLSMVQVPARQEHTGRMSCVKWTFLKKTSEDLRSSVIICDLLELIYAHKYSKFRAISVSDQHHALTWMIGSCVSNKLTFLSVDCSLRFLIPMPCRNCSANRYTFNVVISLKCFECHCECHWMSLYTESSADFWGCNGFRKKAAIAAKARRKASSKNISMASKLLGGNGMWDVMGNVQNAPNRYKVLWKFAGEAAGVPLMLWNDWKQPDRNLAKAERKSSVGQILPAVLVAGVALCFYSFNCFTCPMCLFS